MVMIGVIVTLKLHYFMISHKKLAKIKNWRSSGHGVTIADLRVGEE
jgi:hypothetical protein